MLRENRHPLIGFGVAVILAIAGLTVGSPRAESAPPGVWAECEGVKVAADTYRLFLDPNDVVTGDVVSVRTDKLDWDERADGTWISKQTNERNRLFHVVIKSDAPKFSERRWSGWVGCHPPRP